MSAVTVTLTSICAGGGHLTFTVTGDASLTKTIDLSELTDALDPRDAQGFLEVIVKMAKNGRTLAQARNLLQAGVTVTV